MVEKNNKSHKTSPVWGGRFSEGPDNLMQEINSSIDFDKRLYQQDIRASKAHTSMLVKKKIITKEEGNSICDGLDCILLEIETGKFNFLSSLEDIHMNIEGRLLELIGPTAGKMHTARSRNDQVATDFRLWVRDSLDILILSLTRLQEALIEKAEDNFDTIMPGYTHLQNAQPVTLGHHLLAYVEMFGRDRRRAVDCQKGLNECPLGSGALAGTAFPIDRKVTSLELGFDKPMANSIDGVSDRDFALEFLALSSIACVHLSRLSEDIVLWSSAAFNFLTLPDSFSTGSSMLPQKRNPDAAELVRAKSGKIISALNGLLIVMKGLPLAYSKDMQEDKVPVFETFDTLQLCLEIMTGMINHITFNSEAMMTSASKGHTNAIELADWLVQNLNKPFREAHQIAGSIVRLAEKQQCRIEELTLSDLTSIENGITDKVFEALQIENCVSSKNSFGGTAPNKVKDACKSAKKQFL